MIAFLRTHKGDEVWKTPKYVLAFFQMGHLLTALKNILYSTEDLEHFIVSDWVLHQNVWLKESFYIKSFFLHLIIQNGITINVA